MALIRHRARLSVLALGTVAAVATSLVAGTGTTLAATSLVKPAVAGSDYLALGDSVVFGYRESTNLPTPDYSNAATFVGYPEDVAAALGLHLTNASCPGETTSSMIDKTAASNGCENFFDKTSGRQVVGGYRVDHPLHVAYKRSQLGFAELFLKRHPDTRLVTLTIGANDGFLCQAKTSDGCITELGTLLSTLKTNVATILKGIRGTGYAGQIVLMNYYSYNYTDNFLTGEIQLLNSNIEQAAKPYHVRVASAFDAFKAASVQSGGDTCAAALLTVLTNGTTPCGVHPSVQGSALLAQTVMAKVKK